VTSISTTSCGLASLHLELCTLPGHKTFFSDAHKTWSTIDLVFASNTLPELISCCNTASGHGSDHEAILVTVDVSHTRLKEEPKHQVQEVDWEEFKKQLECHLQDHSLTPSISTTADINTVTLQLTSSLQAVISKVIPLQTLEA